MESGNGNGTGTGTGSGTGTGYGTRNRLLKTEDALMVLTIVTCSKNWTFEINLHHYASFLWSLSYGTYMEKFHEKLQKRA